MKKDLLYLKEKILGYLTEIFGFFGKDVPDGVLLHEFASNLLFLWLVPVCILIFFLLLMFYQAVNEKKRVK